MKFPAISTSNSVLQHLPPKSRLQIHSLVRFRCKFPHFYSIISSSSSASTTNCCSQQRNQASSCPIENQKKQWIHFIGIGGCGLSALAKLALKQGFEVSGSDVARSLFMDGLQENGAVIYLGHSVSNIQRNNGSTLPNAVVVSSAIPSDNVEIVHAKSFGVPVYKRDSWLRKVTSNYNLISVSGTHGKSTTAGMLAYVLSAMGDDLTAIVGAHVPQFPGGNILLGCGSNFVLEADEYDGCFLGLSPYIAVITNVGWEHVDIFQDEEAVRNSFRRFLKQIRVGGHLILCGDSDGARFLLSDTKMETASRDGQYVSSSEMLSAPYSVTTYGISNSNEWHASSVLPNLQGGTDYVLHHMGYPVADICLQLAGNHNVLNSLAVIAAITILFSDRRLTSETVNCVRAHLNNFIGISRRFELIGNVHGCHIYDDYAHHPTEIRATLQAARQRFPLKALWVLFQPHTYSRLAALMEDFANAFNDADRVVVTEVYAARETNIWNVSGRDLATSITGPSSEYIPSLGDVVNKLAVEISTEPDREILVFTLGAGDITTVGPMLFSKLQAVKKLPALENFTGVKDAGKGFHTISNNIIPLQANWEVTEIQGM